MLRGRDRPFPGGGSRGCFPGVVPGGVSSGGPPDRGVDRDVDRDVDQAGAAGPLVPPSGAAGLRARFPSMPGHERQIQSSVSEPGARSGDQIGSAAGSAVAADAYSGAALMSAVGVGTVLSLLYVLSGNAVFRTPWEPADLSFLFPGVLYLFWSLLPLIVPAVVIFAAYVLVARKENRFNVRRQRGALALLGFAAPFLALLLWSTTYSGVYGAALLALALRTRETRTAATGVMAFAAYLAAFFLAESWVVLPMLGLVAVAAFAGSWRVGRGSGNGF